MTLTSQQKKYLRGLTHSLQPVVMIGEKGLSENVMAEIEDALVHHELIKVKLRTDRDTRKELTARIQQQFGAELIHSIGLVASFFRRNSKKPVIELPGKSGSAA